MTSGSENAQPESSAIFKVADADAEQRLDTYLAKKVSGWSRARLQRLIENEDVLVNREKSKAAYRLRAKDEIEIDLVPPPSSDFIPEAIPLDIVYEDDAIVVVNKPAGLVVHPGAGIKSGTLANALAFHFRDLSRRSGEFRPGIVHRLDKGTSGLLVIAKTEVVHEDLAAQFSARTVCKRYIALIHGQVEADAGRIDQPIARDPRNRIRMTVGRSGRSALTLYRVVKRYQRFTLLNLELKTGRTHQIRVHLAWLKHPVVGDELYGSGRDNTVTDPRLRSAISRLQRQFLHAEQLGFAHPTTQLPMHFSAPLPPELSALLGQIESK